MFVLISWPDTNVPTTVTEVNEYYNKVPYVKEEKDDWKTPRRFMREGGDCEDYTIAKYHALKRNHRVAILLGNVNTKGGRGYHAVLLVDGWWVLDNTTNKIYSLPTHTRLYGFHIQEMTNYRRIPVKPEPFLTHPRLSPPK